jgi:hypothetical protein
MIRVEITVIFGTVPFLSAYTFDTCILYWLFAYLLAGATKKEPLSAGGGTLGPSPYFVEM